MMFPIKFIGKRKSTTDLVDLFKGEAFDLSGGIAVGLPKAIADALEIKEGMELNFTVSKGRKIAISKT